jgi:putative transposase
MTAMTEAASAETADRMTAGASALLPLTMSWWMRLMSSGSDISLVAKCRTTGEVAAHLAEIFDIEVSRVTISNITDRVLKGLVEWQSRPWTVYPVIFVDVIHIKIRDGNTANWPVYTTLAVTVTVDGDGERDVLGLWAEEHGDGKEPNTGWGSSPRSCRIRAQTSVLHSVGAGQAC